MLTSGKDSVREHLLLTRYDPERVAAGEMLSVADVEDILAIPLLGVVPESEAVLKASNQGQPVILWVDLEQPLAAADDTAAYKLGMQGFDLAGNPRF